MTLNNRTVAINQSWVGRAVAASLLSGFLGYLPIFLFPRGDVFYGWIEEFFLAGVVCSLPSLIGAFWGRFWIPNLVFACAWATLSFQQGDAQGGIFRLGAGVLSTASMSYLAGRWHLVDGKPRTRPPDSPN